MWMRVIGVVSVVACFGVVGCGDDDSGFEDSCTMGMKSVPGAANDPCPQTDPKCPAAMYVAVASCGVDGKWGKDPTGSIMCACVPRNPVMMMGGTGGMGGATMPPPHPVCGNGMIEPPEQCEPNKLNATCTSLMMGVGVLSCNKTTCMYDASMCGSAMQGMGGSGEQGMGGSGM